jgi:hypothetical protein
MDKPFDEWAISCIIILVGALYAGFQYVAAQLSFLKRIHFVRVNYHVHASSFFKNQLL